MDTVAGPAIASGGESRQRNFRSRAQKPDHFAQQFGMMVEFRRQFEGQAVRAKDYDVMDFPILVSP